jgi:TPR repeat protein
MHCNRLDASAAFIPGTVGRQSRELVKGMLVYGTFKIAAAALIIASSAGSLTAGPFEDGLDAARRADYATVLRLWRPLAEQGDARAQSNLALMYDTGRGVPQNFAVAIDWFRKAAAQGDAGAQSNLGLTYSKGRGVPQDYVSAYMWFDLAAASGDKVAERNRDKIGTKLTPAQIAEAQKLAREWSKKARSLSDREQEANGSALAARRRDTRWR